jgi:hypothetical protein
MLNARARYERERDHLARKDFAQNNADVNDWHGLCPIFVFIRFCADNMRLAFRKACMHRSCMSVCLYRRFAETAVLVRYKVIATDIWYAWILCGRFWLKRMTGRLPSSPHSWCKNFICVKNVSKCNVMLYTCSYVLCSCWCYLVFGCYSLDVKVPGWQAR